MEQYALELTIYVIGDRQDAIETRDRIMNLLAKEEGIRKLADMGLHITAEYEADHFDWTLASATWQVAHGEEGTPRTTSALRYLDYVQRVLDSFEEGHCASCDGHACERA